MKRFSVFCLVVVFLGLTPGFAFSQDMDEDGVLDVDDNCSLIPNGAELGTCVQLIGGIFKGTEITCTDSFECGLNELCDLDQLDFNGNGIGDACECHGAFDNDTDIDGTDAAIFKMGFGRSSFNNPCPPSIGIPCPEGMIDCDDRCVDPLTDEDFCGANMNCLGNTVCGTGEICDSGVCVLNCPSGLTQCSNTCVDTDTDEGFCGSCTNSCSIAEMCVSGSCEIVRDIVYQAAVPKTGQTTSYATGDDGDLEKGVTWPNPRFTDNSDGTVTDNLTGLIWLKDANCIATNYPGFDTDEFAGDGEVTWQHALDFVTGINAGTYPDCGAGSTDWRLPNRNELASLVHNEYYNPTVPNTAGTGKWSEGDPFNNLQSWNYWSSTTRATNTAHAWDLYMYYGVEQGITKTSSVYVWPVRGGYLNRSTY